MSQVVALFSGTWGLAFVFLNVLLERIGLPIPSVPTLLLAGAFGVGRGWWAAEAFVLAVAACLISDMAWYGAGRVYGNRIVRLLCRISISPDTCVSQTQARFDRWGAAAFLVAKFVPGLGALAPPLAGAMRMGLRLFLGASLLGSLLWVAVFMLLGRLAAPQILAILPRLAALGMKALAFVTILLALYVMFKWWQRQRVYQALRMARIDVTELHSMLQHGPLPTILDVRSSSARTLDPRAIPGALHVLPEAAATALSPIGPDKEVVVYCSCPNEASAARVAQLLMRHGIVRVRPLLGGLDAWAAAGYPVAQVIVTREQPVAAAAASGGGG